ncbi:hypothetical protein D3C73_900440 [compost metagenome]
MTTSDLSDSVITEFYHVVFKRSLTLSLNVLHLVTHVLQLGRQVQDVGDFGVVLLQVTQLASQCSNLGHVLIDTGFELHTPIGLTHGFNAERQLIHTTSGRLHVHIDSSIVREQTELTNPRLRITVDTVYVQHAIPEHRQTRVVGNQSTEALEEHGELTSLSQIVFALLQFILSLFQTTPEFLEVTLSRFTHLFGVTRQPFVVTVRTRSRTSTR